MSAIAICTKPPTRRTLPGGRRFPAGSLSAAGSSRGEFRAGVAPAGVERLSRRTFSPTILQSVLFVNYLLSMKCLVVALLIVAFCAPPFSMGADRPRKIPCKTEANAKSCYWTHGRLMLHEGTPSFRLWKIGTHRMLAIWSGPSVDFEGGAADNEHPEFPANIQRVFRPSKNGIFADLEACPLES